MKKVTFAILINITINLWGFNVAKSQEQKTEINFKSHKYLPGYGKKKIKNPAIFQGNKKRKRYFEGWYFKMVSADGSSILSVIPGISLSPNGDNQHAFIQIIDGKTAQTFYFSYPIEEFAFSKKKFAVRIGDNYFSEDSIILNSQNAGTQIKGKILMTNQVRLCLKGKKEKGIMGWYRYMPFMQCYHGVVSLNHNLNGSLLKNDQNYNFENGIGYIEKDWGKSMPSDWIWMQTNNFNSENSSFMLSVANVPWLGSSFTGFLGFFLHNNQIHRFGTYSHAKLQLDSTNSDTVKITISDKKYTYHIKSYHSKSGVLRAPLEGSMDRRISESIDAKLQLKVIDKQGIIIFNDSTSIAGLETVGKITIQNKKAKKKKSSRPN